MEQDIINNEKSLKHLKNSYDMYEKTKRETEIKLKEALNSDGTKRYNSSEIDEQIKLIEGAQEDVITQYTALGGNPDDLKKKKYKKNLTETINSVENNVLSLIQANEDKIKEIEKIKMEEVNTKRIETSYIPKKEEAKFDEVFDIISLPSKGEGYKNKLAKMPVAFLTAYDENMIVSPNLYRDNLILDYILQAKTMNKEIDPLDLLEGDREAIILFLRASGYGVEYPITATDNISGQEFDAIVDLSKLKYKEFNLEGDANGWFKYTLPVSGKEVKFRFPTHRDTITLEKLQTAEDNKTKKDAILRYVENLDIFIENDKTVSKDEKVKIRQAIRTLESWTNKIDDNDSLMFNHTLTNKLNLLVMSVDGITDKEYIYNFIKEMNVKDSSSLRKYIQENEPGIDYTIEIERPESLGGGSMKTFLQLDQFLFLNIA